MPSFQFFRRFQGFVQGDARSNHGHLILWTLPHNFETRNREFFVLRVKNRGLGPRRPHVIDSASPRHCFRQSLRGNGIARIKHRRAMNSPEHRNILKRHLRGAVFTNRDAAMDPHKLIFALLIADIRT